MACMQHVHWYQNRQYLPDVIKINVLYFVSDSVVICNTKTQGMKYMLRKLLTSRSWRLSCFIVTGNVDLICDTKSAYRDFTRVLDAFITSIEL